MDIGIFSQAVFSPEVYDCGILGGSNAQHEEYDYRGQQLREDEEILAIIIAIGSEL